LKNATNLNVLKSKIYRTGGLISRMVSPLLLVQLVLLLPGIVLPMSDDSFIHFPLSSPEG